MNISQYPKPEQIAALVTSTEPGPVVMVNLLKFKARADAPHVGISGMEAYAKYAKAMVGIVEVAMHIRHSVVATRLLLLLAAAVA